MASPNGPSILIPAETAIGYGRNVVATVPADIRLGPGTHFLLARNGRGKSTLLRTLSGNLPAISGKPSTSGRLLYLADDLEFDRVLPSRAIFKAILPAPLFRKALDLADRLELDIGKPFGVLSKGNRQKCLITLLESAASAPGPCVLLMDEPLTGLDAFASESVLTQWRDSADSVTRLITIHPSFDSMPVGRPVTIVDAKIHHAKEDAPVAWGQLKATLN